MLAAALPSFEIQDALFTLGRQEPAKNLTVELDLNTGEMFLSSDDIEEFNQNSQPGTLVESSTELTVQAKTVAGSGAGTESIVLFAALRQKQSIVRGDDGKFRLAIEDSNGNMRTDVVAAIRELLVDRVRAGDPSFSGQPVEIEDDSFEFETTIQISNEIFFSLSSQDVLKVGADLSGVPSEVEVGDVFEIEIDLDPIIHNQLPSFPVGTVVEVTIDFGDGRTASSFATTGTAERTAFFSHAYDQAGTFTITVDGIIQRPGESGGSSADFLASCVPITVRAPNIVEVTGGGGDDDITSRIEGGNLVVSVNGVDEDFGPVAAIDEVRIEAAGGNDIVNVDVGNSVPTLPDFNVDLGSGDDLAKVSGTAAPKSKVTIFGRSGNDDVKTDKYDLAASLDTILFFINLGDGDDTFVGGDANEVVNDGRGEDIVSTGAGNDTHVIGSFDIGTPFELEINRIDLGSGTNKLQIDDIVNQLDFLGGSGNVITPPSGELAEFVAKLVDGVGSSAPQGTFEYNGLKIIEVVQQAQELFFQLTGDTNLEKVEINGSSEDDIVNVQSFTGADPMMGVAFNAFDGDNRFTGSAGDDAVTAGNGDNDFEGRDGNDSFFVGLGNNSIDQGLGDDFVAMLMGAVGLPTTLSIGDSFNQGATVDNDTLAFIKPNTPVEDPNNPGQTLTFDTNLNLDLSQFAGQTIGDNTAIANNNQFLSALQDIENVIVGSNLNFEITGNSEDNTIVVDSSFDAAGLVAAAIADFEAFLAAASAGVPGARFGTILDRGGNDLTDLSYATPLDSITVGTRPNSGDVIANPNEAIVTVSFANALEAVSVDIDLNDFTVQVVDESDNTIQLDGFMANFIGSEFDDTLQIDATLDPRSVDMGDGTDTVTVDAQGRPVTQTVDAGVTTIEVAGFAPIEIAGAETIQIANEGPAGPLTFNLPDGDGDAQLSVATFFRFTDVDENESLLSQFLLSADDLGFDPQQFRVDDAAPIISAGTGTQNLTVDVLQQPADIVGNELRIEGLPPILLNGFADIQLANLPAEPPPTLTLSNFQTMANIPGPPIRLLPSADFMDPDTTGLAGFRASVRFASPFVSLDRLWLLDEGGQRLSSGDDIILSGVTVGTVEQTTFAVKVLFNANATAASVQTVFDQVEFESVSQFGTQDRLGTRNLQFRVLDSNGAAARAYFKVHAQRVNVAPLFTLGNTEATANIPGPAVRLLPFVTFADPDSASLDGVQASVRIIAGHASLDRLWLLDENGQRLMDGDDLILNGLLVGSVVQSGFGVKVAFNGNATPASVRSVFNRVEYGSLSPVATPERLGPRTLQLRVIDAENAATRQYFTVNTERVNIAPLLALENTKATGSIPGPSVRLLPFVTFADPDSSSLNSFRASVRFMAGRASLDRLWLLDESGQRLADGDDLILGGRLVGSVEQSGFGVKVIFNANATASTVRTVFNRVEYGSLATTSTPERIGVRTLEIRVIDAEGAASRATFTVDVA